MKVVIQRVSEASVDIAGKTVGSIEQGLLILLGITHEDSETDIQWLCNKIVNLRIFNDADGVMNQSILDVQGNALVVSQFTLYASTKKGHRPSYIRAAKPDLAIPRYEQFLAELEAKLNKKVPSGVFGADMQVSLVNDGPVSIIIDSCVKD